MAIAAKTALIASITPIMLPGEITMKLVIVQTIITEHTIVAITECFFQLKAEKTIPHDGMYIL